MRVRITQNPYKPEEWWIHSWRWWAPFWKFEIATCNEKEAINIAKRLKNPFVIEVGEA